MNSARGNEAGLAKVNPALGRKGDKPSSTAMVFTARYDAFISYSHAASGEVARAEGPRVRRVDRGVQFRWKAHRNRVRGPDGANVGSLSRYSGIGVRRYNCYPALPPS
jgi:hypothetical protein